MKRHAMQTLARGRGHYRDIVPKFTIVEDLGAGRWHNQREFNVPRVILVLVAAKIPVRPN